MSAIEKLIGHWAELDLAAPSLVHPADRCTMERAQGFNTGFMPYPYVGDISAADVWVLMLNSNIGPADAKQEAGSYFADRLSTNLKQDLGAYEYPMLSMDPKLRDTGTYEYYNKRNGLTKLVAALSKRLGTTENAARRELARRLAVVQLFPYRSISGVPQHLLGEALPSVWFAKAAVAEALKRKLVVVPRSARNWGFAYGVREGNLFTFKADQARSASLQPGGACGGGDAILSRLTAS